jgi:hypothetical protein
MVSGGYRGPQKGKTFLHLLQCGKSLKIFSKTHRAKTNIQIYWQGDLMAIKNVFIGKILANMTQVSNVAPGPLVVINSLLKKIWRCI